MSDNRCEAFKGSEYIPGDDMIVAGVPKNSLASLLLCVYGRTKRGLCLP